MVISREGNNLVIKYYSEVDESVAVQVMDMGSGRMLKTSSAKVTEGSNTIAIPFPQSNTLNRIRIINASDDAVQSKFFVDIE